MDTLAFISKYEEILKERRIPKMQFYKSCGISDAAVSQWRKGKTNPAMTTINKISVYLGVPIAYLLGDSKTQDGMIFSNGTGYGGGTGSGFGFGDGTGYGGPALESEQKEKSSTPEGVELDAEAIQLKEIWDSADQEEREALLAMAKMLKARRNK